MKEILNLHALRRLAGPRSFDRGEKYFTLGLVRSLSEYNGAITAKVKGTHTYTVKLREENGELDYSCTCPMGDDGSFCKHCVAAGLFWLEQKMDGKGKKAGGGGGHDEVTMEDVKGYLETLEKNVLVEMIMQQAEENDALREKLLMQAAQKTGGGRSLAAWKKIIRETIDPGDFIEYHEMSDYAARVRNVLDTLEDLLKDGPVEAMELVDYAIAETEIAIESVDDSNGEMGDILQRLQEVHLAACRKVGPDPEELAARLFDRELNGQYDVFHGAAATYASILGERGLAVYRRLAEEEWKKIKPLVPNKEEREERSHRRFTITHMMESLAEASGDVEALVEVKKKDLSYAYHYLQIAELYKKSGNHDKALEWAEAGLKAFPGRTDSRLRDFLAAEYHRRKRHDEAMKLIWADFSDHASLENFQKLKTHAERVGQWPAWREKALDFIRKDISGTTQSRGGRWGAWNASDGNSLLVEIFLWENESDAAWQEAQAGGCTEQLWMRLAAGREQDHPQDAIDVYKKWIDPTVGRKNNQAYDDAANLLRKIRVLMNRLNRDADFADYLWRVRAAHKPKRNFMKLLDRIN
ncbi:MAG: SWIM zinc finger family protein [Pseudomonadota bacterium]